MWVLMPDVRLYIKDAVWYKILGECGHDPQKAKRKINEMLEAKYGPR